MLDLLSDDIFLHISDFLTLKETFILFSLNNKVLINENKYIQSKWHTEKNIIKMWYKWSENIIRRVEDEIDMKIRFPLWRNKRHYRNENTPILNF